MLGFILKRLLESIPVLLAVMLLTFLMVRLTPGGPFDDEREMPEATRAALNEHYGLDAPLAVQFGNYLKRLVLEGSLGPSYSYPNWPVTKIIAQKAPVSLELGFYALGIALLLGVGIGCVAAIRPNTASDYLPMSLAMVGICLPTFVLGPVLLLIFAVDLEFFNVSGWTTLGDRFLPALTLGLFYAAYIARLTRGSMMEVRSQDYMRTAAAKGLAFPRIYFVHGLRNALPAVVSYLGPALAGLISGSFVVETIFNIPGLGRFFIHSALDKDYTMVMGCVLFYAALLVLFNLLADVLLVLLNPRLKFDD